MNKYIESTKFQAISLLIIKQLDMMEVGEQYI